MDEYGLTPDELIAKDFRRIQSSRRGYQPYGRSDWIAAIKKMHKQGGSIFAGELQDKYPHLYAQGMWIFGDWDRALRAAGFDPERMRMRRFWDGEQVVKEIRRLRSRNVPLFARHVIRNYPGLFSGGIRQYGSWDKALVAAGVTDKEVPSKTRLGLLRELREAVESGREIPQVLRLQIAHYFGSLRKARIALKTDAKLLRGWSKRKIVAALTEMP